MHKACGVCVVCAWGHINTTVLGTILSSPPPSLT